MIGQLINYLIRESVVNCFDNQPIKKSETWFAGSVVIAFWAVGWTKEAS